jgi:pyruvate,water dikinase
VNQFEVLETRVIPAWDVPLLNDLYCMIFHGALRKLCERWLPEELTDVHNNLVSGEAGIISLEPVRRMQKMAVLARCDSDFVALLNNASAASIRKGMTTRGAFQDEFDAYLNEFGDRCMDELKLESLTVADDPLPLLRAVGQMAMMTIGESRNLDTSTLRPDAEKDVWHELRRSPLRRWIFNRVLGLARARVRDRENLRFERTRVYGRVRAIFVEIGKQLQTQDIIAAADDIFYLEVGEVIRFVQGTSASIALCGTVAARRQEFTDYQTMPNPPRRFMTCGPAQLKTSRRAVEDDDVETDEFYRKGQACSQGTVRGPVRIVRDPRAANVQAGEILVAERTDPGWVTIFPLVTGMIMERGSLLSHSAIVARELGLPCVVGVEDACNWLRDGDWVEIDGATGMIRRLEADEKAA